MICRCRQAADAGGRVLPSTALVFGEDEKGPAIAAGDPDAMDQAVAEQLEEVAALAEELNADDAERLYELHRKRHSIRTRRSNSRRF